MSIKYGLENVDLIICPASYFFIVLSPYPNLSHLPPQSWHLIPIFLDELQKEKHAKTSGESTFSDYVSLNEKC